MAGMGEGGPKERGRRGKEGQVSQAQPRIC